MIELYIRKFRKTAQFILIRNTDKKKLKKGYDLF